MERPAMKARWAARHQRMIGCWLAVAVSKVMLGRQWVRQQVTNIQDTSVVKLKPNEIVTLIFPFHINHSLLDAIFVVIKRSSVRIGIHKQT